MKKISKKVLKNVCMLSFSLFLIISMFFVNAAVICAQKDKEEWVLIQETVYDANGSIEKSNRYEYDIYGNTVKEIINTSEGEYKETYENEYDDSHRLIRKTTYSNGEYEGTYSIYDYDAKGNLIYELSYYEDEEDCETEYEYDNQNHIISINYYYYDDEGEFTEKYKYDHQGRLIKQIDLDKDGPLGIHEYTYKKNFMVDYDYNGSKDTLMGIYTTYYDDQGYILKKEYESDVVQLDIREQEYIYDKYGNNTEIISYDENGVVVDRTTMKYKRLK